MTHDDNTITNSAHELIERLGGSALVYVNDRIDSLREIGNPREIDQAHQLLSEIEKLLAKEAP